MIYPDHRQKVSRTPFMARVFGRKKWWRDGDMYIRVCYWRGEIYVIDAIEVVL